VTPAARRASDAFARAAHAVDGDGMVIAFGAHDDAPIGAASMTFRGTVATLGGMSTVPEHRRRGVQAALVDHRLRVAAGRDCTLAAATAASGGDSERNLIRLGFTPRFVIETWQLPSST
jgi:GNAT superfamily N-acetyltransferase